MLKSKMKHFKSAVEYNDRLFKSKEETRKKWAKRPVEMKIKELIKLQEITATLHPELRNIIPWRSKIKEQNKFFRRKKTRRNGSDVLDGYRAITKEEMRNLKKMTIKDSIE